MQIGGIQARNIYCENSQCYSYRNRNSNHPYARAAAIQVHFLTASMLLVQLENAEADEIN
jgi:hypothetical protein